MKWFWPVFWSFKKQRCAQVIKVSDWWFYSEAPVLPLHLSMAKAAHSYTVCLRSAGLRSKKVCKSAIFRVQLSGLKPLASHTCTLIWILGFWSSEVALYLILLWPSSLTISIYARLHVVYACSASAARLLYSNLVSRTLFFYGEGKIYFPFPIFQWCARDVQPLTMGTYTLHDLAEHCGLLVDKAHILPTGCWLK